jgi:hypothetical protein
LQAAFADISIVKSTMPKTVNEIIAENSRERRRPLWRSLRPRHLRSFDTRAEVRVGERHRVKNAYPIILAHRGLSEAR